MVRYVCGAEVSSMALSGARRSAASGPLREEDPPRRWRGRRVRSASCFLSLHVVQGFSVCGCDSHSKRGGNVYEGMPSYAQGLRQARATTNMFHRLNELRKTRRPPLRGGLSCYREFNPAVRNSEWR